MSEITFTLTEDEARALLPQNTRTLGVEGWNRRQDLAEDAQAKIKAALREQAPVVSAAQESLGGLA
jgi:hypothetical protein